MSWTRATVVVSCLAWGLLVIGLQGLVTASGALAGTGSMDPPAQMDGVAAKQRLPWEHLGLDLYLWDVDEFQGRAQFRFLLQLKPGAEQAATTVGFPRYRAESGRWHDAVMRGVAGRNRNVQASAHNSGQVFFSVVVPRSSSGLTVPVGGRNVRLDTSAWITWLQHRRASAVAPRPVAPPPGRPVSLSAGVRWSGEKPFGDGALDAEESGELLVDVFNTGERRATGVRVRIDPGAADGLVYPAELPVPEVEPGGVGTIRVPLSADSTVLDGTARLTLHVVEPFGHDAAPIEFELPTRSLDPPVLVLTDDFAVDGAEFPVPRDNIVTLHLRVRNVGQGLARDVAADVTTGEGVFPAHDSATRFELGDLSPGQVRQFTYRCYANQRADGLVLDVELADGRNGVKPVVSQLILPLEDSDLVPRIVQVNADPRAAPLPLGPAPPPLTSDVDRHVPLVTTPRPDAIAVVLGVERYASAPPATYAAADARTAARYFELTLGIPRENIEVLLDEDVSLAQMNRVFGKDGWLSRRVEEDSEVFVFFAGHGVAESQAFDPYLVPHDGDLNYVRQTAMSLDALVGRLAALDAAQVTLFLDACFSGLTREGGALLSGTRRLVVVPVHRGLSGVSVFSAARGSQTAHGLDEHGHGLFSYFLFKGLGGAADVNGDRLVTAGELGFYLENQVPRAAALADLEQTPSIFVDDMDRVLVPLP